MTPIFKSRFVSLALVTGFIAGMTAVSTSARACDMDEHHASAKTSDTVVTTAAHSNLASNEKLATRKFKIDGISCSGCQKMIQSKLHAVQGVKGVQFTHGKIQNKRVNFIEVSYVQGSVSNEQILGAIASAGDHYKATLVTN